MRVLMPSGIVMTVERAIAVCEQRTSFNGRSVRLCEGATDMAYANAIAFFSEANVQSVATGVSVLLGNLSNGFVREVLDSLVRQGYVDLSGLKLQKEQLSTTLDYVFDNGASAAYMLQGFEVNMCCGYPFMSGTSPVYKSEDVEDAREEECTDE